jgi:hypothetical protein
MKLQDKEEYDNIMDAENDQIDQASDYNHISTKDVKNKLLELKEEALQNHQILIMQNNKLQE